MANAESVDSCALYCRMKAYGNTGNMNDLCTVFYYASSGINQQCFIGNREVTTGPISNLTGSHDVYFDPSKRNNSSLLAKDP